MVGIAQKVIYEEGAEYEGLPMYVFSEKSTSHAISRSGYRTIGKDDIVQLNLSAKIDGYSPAIGLPIAMELDVRDREYDWSDTVYVYRVNADGSITEISTPSRSIGANVRFSKFMN